MATIAHLNTPARQPFGILNDSKLRNLQSIKNRQNAITPMSAPSLKRRAPSPELSDSENVDPNILDSMSKRKRGAEEDDISLSKRSRYNLHVVPTAEIRSSVPVLAPVMTPRLDVVSKPVTAPLSAPAAAGRSPTKGKRMGLMQSRKRFAPPSFNTRSPSLSITAALNGTLAHKKAKKPRTIEETKPKSWFFEIFEETEEHQEYKMNEWTMTQSAIILDISDDEGKMKEKSDKGKENVDPNDDLSAPVTRSTTTVRETKISRKDAMLDEPRTPLGDLNPSEFYAEGLDATSVVLVHEDEVPREPAHVELKEEPQVQAELQTDFAFEAVEKLPEEASLYGDIHSLIAASKPTWEIYESNESTSPDDDLLKPDSGSIEIWESESAKDEEENIDIKLDETEAFALQEL